MPALEVSDESLTHGPGQTSDCQAGSSFPAGMTNKFRAISPRRSQKAAGPEVAQRLAAAIRWHQLEVDAAGCCQLADRSYLVVSEEATKKTFWWFKMD